MDTISFEILNYEHAHQVEIDQMMQEIAAEFEQPISLPPNQVPEHLKRLPNPYWVAMVNGKLAGTAGLAKMADNCLALRKMFVRKEFRGKKISATLLFKAISCARETKASCMYLGTMGQFIAAQKFYEKHGFVKVAREQVPTDFPINPVDTVFYKMILNHTH